MTIKNINKIPCEVFSRVVGYYRPVQNFNEGKLDEFNNRVQFKVESL
jgi:ribonucleoside-triphosphate reductase